MESDLQQNRHNLFHHHHHQQQMNSGLMRYGSAPSSYFSNFIDSEEVFLNPRPSTPQANQFFSGFSSSHNICDEIQQSTPITDTGANCQAAQFMAPMKHEAEVVIQQQQQQQNDYCSASHTIYSCPQPPLGNNSTTSGSALDSRYKGMNSVGMEPLPPQMKMGGGNNHLTRHSSSPAGLFSHINIENGYVTMRGMGNLGGGNGAEAEPSASMLKNQINFPSGPPSSSSSLLMAPISEIGNKSMGQSSSSDNGSYITEFPIGSWDDSTIMPENFTGLKRDRDDDGGGYDDRHTYSGLNASETKNEETRNRPPTVLSHHMSLPKTSAEIAAMEKFLQFQDSVPCKIRAKRGCATHPRSIAERVRRTRISERMRKLQELVPNMDKQTNTADMLDLAVDYIKELQKQVKTLSENRAKCTCSSKQKTHMKKA